VVPSLNENSEKSSPFEVLALTIPPSTLDFLASAVDTLAMSGSDSVLVVFAKDDYRFKIIILRRKRAYLESLVTEVLNDGLHFVISEEINWVSCGVESLIKVGLE
jgi:hypothetical protein